MTTSHRRRLSELTGLTPLLSATVCPDPLAVYRELRDRWGMVAPVELEPGINAWLVMGHQELCHVARNERLFARDPHNWRLLAEGRVAPDSDLGPMMFPRDNASYVDGEKHRRLRAPVDDGLAGLDEHRVSRSVRDTCAALVDEFAGRGAADLIADYAAVVPMLTVAGLFGIGVEDGYRLRAAIIALVSSAADSREPALAIESILTEVMGARRATPADDLTTAFLRHPNLRDDYEIQQAMVMTIAAAAQSTMSWIALTLRLMLADPRFAGRLWGGLLGIDDALDEVLWRDPPVANMPARFAMVDCDLAGTRIERGDALILGLAAANADPRVHTDDSWLEVGNRSHLAWSVGPHACPAQRVGRMITRIAVETALRGLHGLTLAVPVEEVTLMPSPWTRCPASLPVRFQPR
ncbi:cytochrome P450 [Actinophytocola gossypii]|uniref:Cytochrome P450 n=1 Tax=Actinophytocola gossypii TaxID=2812003 RepID=A0ABT2J6D4_9PSEU|nr:cytochrome P450 [Actinophytocola gossypii]MCT2583416.1 cytochrome P450 [Actinophytocola gossypii]